MLGLHQLLTDQIVIIYIPLTNSVDAPRASCGRIHPLALGSFAVYRLSQRPKVRQGVVCATWLLWHDQNRLFLPGQLTQPVVGFSAITKGTGLSPWPLETKYV